MARTAQNQVSIQLFFISSKQIDVHSLSEALSYPCPASLSFQSFVDHLEVLFSWIILPGLDLLNIHSKDSNKGYLQKY
jgi:hypothetical protein